MEPKLTRELTKSSCASLITSVDMPSTRLILDLLRLSVTSKHSSCHALIHSISIPPRLLGCGVLCKMRNRPVPATHSTDKDCGYLAFSIRRPFRPNRLPRWFSAILWHLSRLSTLNYFNFNPALQRTGHIRYLAAD